MISIVASATSRVLVYIYLLVVVAIRMLYDIVKLVYFHRTKDCLNIWNINEQVDPIMNSNEQVDLIMNSNGQVDLIMNSNGQVDRTIHQKISLEKG